MIKRSLRFFSPREKLHIVAVTLLQIFINILDLIGVAAIGVLGALAVNGIQSQKPGDRVTKVLELLRIEELTFQQQTAIIGTAAAFILIARTIFSVIITRKILFYLSNRSAIISSRLISSLLSRNILVIREMTQQQILFSVTTGVTSVTIGVIGNLISLVADSLLLILLLGGLFIVDPAISITTLVLFGATGIILYWLMQKRARFLGILNSELSVKSNEKIIEVLNTYRESVVHDRRPYYSLEISKQRQELAKNIAEMSFLPNITKYVIESTLVFGTLLIAALQFVTQDSSRAIATFSLFLAAGARIAPAVMRIQQGAISMKGSLGVAEPTLALFERFGLGKIDPNVSPVFQPDYQNFFPKVEVSNLRFKYPGTSKFSIDDISLQIAPGESVAIVGPSGAGKTTFIDLLLGIMEPSSGNIRISGLAPQIVVNKFPGAISYVPQDVVIIDGTIRENVMLGYAPDIDSGELVNNSLKLAQLSDVVNSLPNGIDSKVGEKGTRLSGGQRQRLGIARALFTSPRLLVLDEATSSLDGKTESDITKAIESLHGQVTVILIAHRLSTVMSCDKIVYMEDGQIIEIGTFDELTNKVPNFRFQVEQMRNKIK